MVFTLAALFTGAYSLYTLFFLTFSASLIPIPTMGTIIVSFGAYTTNIPSLIQIILLTYIAALIGDILAYFIARKFSKPVLNFLRRFEWYHKSEKKTLARLEKYGFYLVFVTRFLNTELCIITNYICGFTKFNSKKFITAVLIGEFIYTSFYSTFGYIFKDSWIYLLGVIENSLWIIILVIVVFYLTHNIQKRIRRRNNARDISIDKAIKKI